MLHFLYKCLFSSLIFLAFVGSSQAQTVVSNIRTDYNTDRMKITYDLEKANPQDSIYVQVESKSKGYLPVKTITGEVGKGITSGTNKVIYWDYALDGIKIDDEQIRVHIQVFNSAIKPNTGAGPVSALASVVLPGVGNMLVNRKIGLRPLISISYIGLLAYGLMERKKANEQYAIYNSSQYDYLPAEAEPFYQQANKHRQNFYYALQGAGLIMAADVIYSVIKGSKNARIKRSQPRISLHYIGNTPALAYQLNF
ncbi:hypothetical protein [Siphonobacter sp. SORGH_AS_1065]|uniref:hypothetical protein n=1 Tax=Siphonobacter sp. SORGH_AS_1065 TaxID=3041795 RepID=UPI00277DC7F6|nr:hypothetical protein [Siphonobacter sp. SORGH_AS_1065]MDQ1089712.1 hypothetical protein [Siphonobacter sp. SORGH_AS_1065]